MTRASDTARLLGAGATILDGTTISTADNDPQLILTSTDADANRGPELHFVRDSASPADNDLCGTIKAFGKNSAGEDVQLSEIIFRNEDVTDGTEDGQIILNMMRNGTSAQVMKLSSTETVLNGDSVDLDFRIESNDDTHCLHIDGGNNVVSINNSVASSMSTDSNNLVVGSGSGNEGITIFSATDGTGNIYYADGSSGNTRYRGWLEYAHSSDYLNFGVAGTARMRLFQELLIGKTADDIGTNGIRISASGGYSAFTRSNDPVLYVRRNTSDGVIVNFMQDSGTEGSISVSGSTVSYNSFSGSHWSRLTDNSKPTILKGTIIETIDEMCDWYRVKFTIAETEDIPERIEEVSVALPSGKSVGDTMSYTHEGITYDNAVIVKEENEKHPKCKISDTVDSKRVYGVHMAWDNDDDTVNDMYVTAVGTYVVRINKDVTVSAGDLLSSNGDGTAKVQDDDIIRSKTIGKVLTNIKQETYSDGSYTVPCALYCG